ncbi:hypothetical protein [Larkinella punicea]|uniref:hypothetical protein n=1 Tax=Larkinella punicea TaxID=2315727 RepID=UPI0010587F54|nr:hypothetical protein [Larkinella punicea]
MQRAKQSRVFRPSYTSPDRSNVQRPIMVSRKRELFFDGVVGQFVKPKLLKLFILPGHFTQSITSLIGSTERIKQVLSLFGSREEFYFGSQFHNPKIRKVFQSLKNHVSPEGSADADGPPLRSLSSPPKKAGSFRSDFMNEA